MQTQQAEHSAATKPQELVYTSISTPVRTRGWAVVVAFTLSFLTIVLFPCMGGHIGMDGLPTSCLGAAFAWYGAWRNENRSLLWRGVHLVSLLFATLVLLKNVADVLWFGHHPLLRP